LIHLIAISDNSEKLVEYAGRTCYNSNGAGDYVTCNNEKGNHGKIIESWIESKHDSVLEHASATFEITCSRSALAQITRHRLFSYSVKSQRYVGEHDFEYIIPPSIDQDPDLRERYLAFMKTTKEFYGFLASNVKKEDARFVLPNAAETTLIMTGNFRSWRHFLKLRLDSHAQWEIREIAKEIHSELQKHAPIVFKELT